MAGHRGVALMSHKGQHSNASGPPPNSFGNTNFGRGMWIYGIDRARMEGQLAFDVFNDLCVLIFTAEIVIYVLAYGWTNYVGTIQRPKNVGNVLLVAGLWIVCIHAHLQHSETLAASPLDWIQVFQAVDKVIRASVEAVAV